MLKILQARLQRYVNCELPDAQAGFRKGRGTRDQIASIHWIIEKAREFHLLQNRSHLGHKSSLGKFKKIEIIPVIFSDHSAIRLDLSYRKKKIVKNSNICRLNNKLLNNQQIIEEIKKEIKICIEMN